MRHGDIGDVRCPHVVRLGNRHAAQQIGINLVSRRGFARAGTRNQRDDPHQAHQPLHAFAVDRPAFLVEFEHYPSRTVKRQFDMKDVNTAHQRQIVRRRAVFGPVDARARQRQKFTLAAHG